MAKWFSHRRSVIMIRPLMIQNFVGLWDHSPRDDPVCVGGKAEPVETPRSTLEVVLLLNS